MIMRCGLTEIPGIPRVAEEGQEELQALQGALDMGRIQFRQVVYHFYKGIFQAWPICSC